MQDLRVCSQIGMGRFIAAMLCTLLAYSATSQAATVAQEMKFSDAYLIPVDKQTNSMTVEVNRQTRDSMHGNLLAIPAGWRLVNVVAHKPDNYVLFFQAADGGVYAFALSADGQIDGLHTWHIPAGR